MYHQAKHRALGSIAVAIAVVCSERAVAQGTHLLVPSMNNPSILRYDGLTGASDGTFASDPELQLGDGGVGDLTIGPDGNLYVTIHGLDRVTKYEVVCGTGERIGVFAGAEPGSGGGIQPGIYLDGPAGLDFGPDGHLYVVSAHHYTILRYDGISGGQTPLITCNLGSSINPLILNFGPDGMLYFSGGSDAILRFTGFDSCSYETFVPAGSGGLDFHDAGGFTWGPDGNLYVASENSDSILRFDGTTGAPLPTAGQSGALFAGWDGLVLDWPRTVTFGPDGNLYVTATFIDHVHRYNGTTGQYMGIS